MKKRANSWADADVQRAERAAIKAFDDLELAHPTEASMEAIAYELGALVRDIPMWGAVGRLTRLRDRAIISVNSSVTWPGRRRWTIAHELGHLTLHGDQNQLQLIQDVTLEEQYDQGLEREANVFAGEFLMPGRLWEKLVDVKQPSFEVIRRLAEDYEVSFQASAIRFVKLCPERCAVVFCQEGCVGWFALGPDFGHRHTLAYDYFAKGTVPQRAEAVSASAWLSDDRVRDGEIVEDCTLISSLRATLSLLWIPDDAEL